MAFVSTSNLIAYWPLNESSGNALDAMGVYNLTDNGTVQANTGKISGAREFLRANSEYFSLADNAAFSTGDIDFSISCWVYVGEIVNNQFIFSKYTTTGNQREYALDFEASSTRLRLIVSSAGTATSATVSSAVISANTWYFVCVGHNATSNDIWISLNAGTPVTTSHATGVFDGTSALHVGSQVTTSNLFTGRIDELSFWKRDIRTDAATIYNSGTGITYATPATTVSPVLSGVARVGRQLLSSEGTWNTGYGALTYQWYTNTTNSTSGGTLISGATSATYTLTSGELGLYVYCVATLTNPNAATGSASNVLGPVAAAFSTTELEPDETSATLHAWYDAADPACFTGGVFPADDAAVTFLDKSGNARHLIQDGSVALPLYKAAIANGIGGIRFEPTTTDRRLKCSSFYGNWTTGWHFIIVLRNRNTSGTSQEVFWDGTSGHWMRGLYRNVGGDDKTYWAGARSKAADEFLVLSFGGNSSSESSGVPPSSELGYNGSLLGAGNTVPSTPVNGNTITLAREGSNEQYDLCELIYYSTPVDRLERASVERGLCEKYGLTADDGDHAVIFLGNSTSAFTDAVGSYPSFVRESLRAEGYDPEIWNLGQPSGTDATLTNQKTYFESIVADCVSRGKKVVVVLFHGHNNNGWSSGSSVQGVLETYLSSVKSSYPNDVKTISVSCTGTSEASGISQANWEANRDWHRNSGLTYHDGIVDTSQFSFAASYNVHDGANDTGNWYADQVHFTQAGKEALAAAVYPEVLAQLEAFDAATGGSNYTTPVQGPFFSPGFSPANPPSMLVRG